VTRPNDESADGAGSYRRLGKWYLMHAGVVGVLFLLLALVGTQAARSGSEVAAALLAAVLQPVPMLIVGLAAQQGWRWITPLAVVLPFALGLCLLTVFGPGAPPMRDRTSASIFFAYFCVGQLYNLPGAGVLALVTIGLGFRVAKRRRVLATGGEPSA